MADHLTPAELRGFLARALPAAEIGRADGHLARCPDCRTALASLADARGAGRLLAAVRRGDAHLPYERIEAYVDGRLAPAERAAVEAHAAGCPSCARELAEMTGYARELARPVPRRASSRA
jgi:anti-sigma factor RsiW